MTIHEDSRGMTLVELMVVVVLGGLVLAAMFQVMVTNQRTFAAQNAQVQGQQTLRAGMDVLFGELREISPQDGDLISMGDQALAVRVGRSVGLVCSILSSGNNPSVQAKKVGRFLRGDSARVFYENNPGFRSDDDWRTTRVQVLDSTGLLTCPDGEPAQEVRLHGVRYGSPPDSILSGSLIRNFAHYTYELGSYNGRTYLLRVERGGGTTPLVGPLDSDGGVRFRYLDEDGNPTTVSADVRQIGVTLRTGSDFQNAAGESYRDSLTTRIFTRNSSS